MPSSRSPSSSPERGVVGDVLLLAASFAVILVGALTFTNAVEWLGHKLSLGEGATGSLLAAVGTAMPESLIPLVAILGGAEGSEDVAIDVPDAVKWAGAVVFLAGYAGYVTATLRGGGEMQAEETLQPLVLQRV